MSFANLVGNQKTTYGSGAILASAGGDNPEAIRFAKHVTTHAAILGQDRTMGIRVNSQEDQSIGR